MQNIDELKTKAKGAIDKKATFGNDIDLSQYDRSFVPHQYLAEEEICALPDNEQERLLMSGLDVTDKGTGRNLFSERYNSHSLPQHGRRH